MAFKSTITARVISLNPQPSNACQQLGSAVRYLYVGGKTAVTFTAVKANQLSITAIRILRNHPPHVTRVTSIRTKVFLFWAQWFRHFSHPAISARESVSLKI